MKLNLQDKTVAITGGARGIGKSVAEEFMKEGCNVAICDINEETLAEANKYFKNKYKEVYTERVDVCAADQVRGFAEKASRIYGHLDIWVNNAGVFAAKPLLEMTLEEWERVIRINMNSVFLGTQSAAREMIKTGGGVIINTASYAGIMPTAHKISYGASKAGIIAMTKESAGELAPYNIRVNSVAPGMISTDMMPGNNEHLLNRIALRKMGRPEDVAKMCVFLASEAANYITGATYEVTGGMYCIQDVLTPWEIK